MTAICVISITIGRSFVCLIQQFSLCPELLPLDDNPAVGNGGLSSALSVTELSGTG
jgi:hypothetical protein